MTSPDLQTPLQVALQDSVLVVAHPDDEILWFGSVVGKVASIVICFEADPANPELSEARRKCIDEHPYRDRIINLGLEETRAFNKAGWPQPEQTDAGLDIAKDPQIAAVYERRAQELRSALDKTELPIANVFTHNPWGEYGHEEHVMVSRAATAWAGHRNAAVWYDNYASNWSYGLMLAHLEVSGRRWIKAEVAMQEMHDIADIYKKHGAWTWLDDYEMFHHDHFIQGPLPAKDSFRPQSLLPINLLRLDPKKERTPPAPSGPLARMQRALARILGNSQYGPKNNA